MSHADDSAGARTYRALGFDLIGRLYQWRKELRANADLAGG
jgi:hypothetical protein